MSTFDDDALLYHSKGRPGKIAIRPTKPLATQRDLALAYSPGVAQPCLKIAEDQSKVFEYTARGNLVAVITNGTAVLGLGNIGPHAAKPVMEGKGVLFKRFADIDVFDLEVDSKDPDHFIEVVAALEPTFGGVNLEDIKAPECFYIEETLKKRMQIPVFHDDQHGTSIIASAAVINAIHIAGKSLDSIRCVFAGAGAAAIACAQLLVELGVPLEHIILCDIDGVLHKGRTDIDPYRARFLSDTPHRTLGEAFQGADVFIGVSAGNIVSKDMVRSMADKPIIMALANPDPEISYHDAKEARPDAIVATGRSDFPNQVNNVLGFPFIFRGALDTHARSVNTAMKRAAVHALAQLAREEVPEEVKAAYGVEDLSFGMEYIIPKPFDHRALLRVAPAVAKAAIESGAARRSIDDWDAYIGHLESILGREREVIRRVIHKAARAPKRVVFPEGDHPRILQAARAIVDEGVAHPILLGSPERIRGVAEALRVNLTGIEIIEPKSSPQYDRYVQTYWSQRQRNGVTLQDAERYIAARSYFAAMMVHIGDAHCMVSGIDHNYPDTIRPALRIIGARPGVQRVAGAHLMIYPHGLKLFADTTVNINPSAEDLAEIAIHTADLARSLDLKPHVALLSFSDFGTNKTPEVDKVQHAVRLIRKLDPALSVDGEMQGDTAINRTRRKTLFPFATLDEDANVLIFPELNSGSIAYKLLKEMDDITSFGPLLIGMNKPVGVLERDCSISTILALTAITVVQSHN